ncbi:MAG: hypothetical protein JWN37_62 [Candidatus Nomurabacteria bacterium]|nr:hypothetical protein [Candidatus Nomurabacteria bacterium]
MKDSPILFYESEFYIFSNFSSFVVEWRGKLWMTVEHAYQASKFTDEMIQEEIRNARSADEAYRIAHRHEEKMDASLKSQKLEIMEDIIRAKITQHEYVQKKLRDSGEREIIEESYRDAFWGWGPNKDGQNNLGKIWMKLRNELKGTP